jgi:hypothetical protein
VSRWQRIALKIVYWLAVLAVSVVILVVLILLIESRDKSSVKTAPAAAPLGVSRPLKPLGQLKGARPPASRTRRCGGKRCKAGGTH